MRMLPTSTPSEAFPPFAIAVLMAQFTQVDAQRVAWLAMAFIAFRILHGGSPPGRTCCAAWCGFADSVAWRR